MSELPCASASKRVFLRNHSYENMFPLHAHHANQTHCYMKGFAQTRFETEAQDNSEIAS